MKLLEILNLSIQQAITLAIALTALLLSGWNLFIQRYHNRLSVKPHLSLQNKWAGGARKIFLKNVGLGPAIICKDYLKYKGKVIPIKMNTDFEDLADLIGGGFYSGGDPLEQNQVIEKGNTVNILGFSWHEQKDEHEAQNEIVNFLENAEYTVEYKSMYGQKEKLIKKLVSPDDYAYF
jgi:hypothetical protein